MPIFHDKEESPPRQSPEVADNDDGRPLESVERVWRSKGTHAPTKPRSPVPMEGEERSLSREELIERIKRGGSPTWTFRFGFGKRFSNQPSPKVSPPQSPPLTLLPSVEVEESPKRNEEEILDNRSAGTEIARPRSALHSGDFREEKENEREQSVSNSSLATSPVAPWHSNFPSFTGARSFDLRPQTRSRSTTQTSTGQFVLMPPTSPLVQATYNSDLDFSTKSAPKKRSRSPQKENRRHTFSPHSFQSYRAAAFGSSPNTPRPVPTVRRESTFPYQAHQPHLQRFGNSFSQSISNPHTPLLRPRGLSNASESSPLHHAPMVGSYEESILRGRMSTTPSRPLNFVAQIGVLGRGKCKSSLRCPPHAHVPFPAVFYSYGGPGGRIMDNQPSPYVGLIDIENTLPQSNEIRDESRRRRRRYATPGSDHDDIDMSFIGDNHEPTEISDLMIKRKKERLKKRSQSPKAPPGGSYRIPQQGQLQIILKNPNKTAVKLFLVPYDLADMEPGQKTFIRQRSYSAGPILDMPISARTNLGTDRPEASLCNSEDPRDRPVLRYLIHLHICCSSRGRYYLYKSIRVVFANRVPDGKEKLRNEIQLPEPKYSVYKPTRDAAAAAAAAAGVTTPSMAAVRRRSTPFALGGRDKVDGIVGLDWAEAPSGVGATMGPIPFVLGGHLPTVESRPGSSERMDMDGDSAERNPFVKRRTDGRSPHDDEYQQVASSVTAAASATPQGLLARQLRELSVERRDVGESQM